MRPSPLARALLFPLALGAAPAAASGLPPGAAHALAPSGTLRVGVVRAPQAGAFFAGVGLDGAPRGVTVDLGAALARDLGVPVAYTVLANSGECTDAVASGAVDVGFMPVDPARSARVAFGPGYAEIESTYLASAASGMRALADVDRPGARVIGLADTTTIRAAARSLRAVQPMPVRGVEEGVAMLRDGRADALALSRDSLEQIAPTVPGSRLLDGGFQRTRIAVAVPPGRPEALAAASAFIEDAARDGTVARAFAAQGLAPPAASP